MIKGLNHITIAVHELNQSIQFYQNILGFKLLMSWSKGAYFLAGDLWFCLLEDSRTRTTPLNEYTHFAFSVDASDFNVMVGKIIDSGVTLWKENTSEGSSLYFLDPNGHKLEIHVGNWQSRLVETQKKPWELQLKFYTDHTNNIISNAETFTDASSPKFLTSEALSKDLIRLGIKKNDLVMLHASYKAIGLLLGGPDDVIKSIDEVIGSEGTLMMYTGWEHHPYHLKKWSKEKQQAFLQNGPTFDPKHSRAQRNHSIIAEFFRTSPHTVSSVHPEARITARGPLAEELTQEHPYLYGYGDNSPLGKFKKRNGKVLMLGAPLNTMTLLHHCEHLANVANKNIAKYQAPVFTNGQRVWIDLEEFDTSLGIVDWPNDYFEEILQSALSQNLGTVQQVGSAKSYLFESSKIAPYAIAWMEQNFNK